MCTITMPLTSFTHRLKQTPSQHRTRSQHTWNMANVGSSHTNINKKKLYTCLLACENHSKFQLGCLHKHVHLHQIEVLNP